MNGNYTMTALMPRLPPLSTGVQAVATGAQQQGHATSGPHTVLQRAALLHQHRAGTRAMKYMAQKNNLMKNVEF